MREQTTATGAVERGSTTFTPGPWRANDFRVERDPRGVPYGTLDPDRHIAVVVGNTTAWRAETEANARLIAAAPELYQALDGALAGDGHDESCGVWQVLTAKGPEAVEAACGCWVAIARRAIAKARGEAVPA